LKNIENPVHYCYTEIYHTLLVDDLIIEIFTLYFFKSLNYVFKLKNNTYLPRLKDIMINI